MRNKLTRKRKILLGVIFSLSLFSFVYVNCPAATGVSLQNNDEVEEKIFQEKLSPEVAAVKFMLGIANFIITSDR